MSLTVGIEVEHGMVPPARGADQTRYDELVEQEKRARILSDLRVDGHFPEGAHATTTLCAIKKFDDETGEYKDFLSVSFDTHKAKSMLEFASVGVTPDGSGILSHRQFLLEENLRDIREAIGEFDSLVKSRRRPGAAPPRQEAAPAAGAVVQPKFQFEIARHAEPFLSNGLAAKKTGAIHVTHSFNTGVAQKTCLQFTQFANPKSARLRDRDVHLRQLPPSLSNISTSGIPYQNSYRDDYSPNPKTPRELMALGDDRICPMSNTVKDARADLESYRAVRVMLSAKIDEGAGDVEPLRAARAKLDNTVALIQTHLSVTDSKTSRVREKGPNEYLFDSLEYRIQPSIDDTTCLLEHRSGRIVDFVAKAIEHEKYDKREYSLICEKLDTVAPITIAAVPLLQQPPVRGQEAAASAQSAAPMPVARDSTHSSPSQRQAMASQVRNLQGTLEAQDPGARAASPVLSPDRRSRSPSPRLEDHG